MATIRQCLAALGVTTAEVFAGCGGTAEEFGAVKKLYFKLALSHHPDKGGDAARFREIQESFEAVRTLYDSGKVPAAGFAHYLGGGAGAGAKASAPSGRTGQPTPSYDWFADAAEEAVPGYRVELAKSGRSQCKATGAACKHEEAPFIAQGEIRFGSMDPEAGAYGRWRHMSCWRVPASIWMGMPDPESSAREEVVAAIVRMQQVSFCGFTELSEADQALVVDYMMDKANWARRTKNSKAAGGAAGGAAAGDAEADEAGAGGSALPPPPSKALVTQGGPGGAFVVPRPGMNGALANAFASKTFVMTGVFPELGGGAGLELGKARCKAMIEAFGGRVTSAVSGKTDYLVVGKAPGAKKVSEAIAKGVPTVDIAGLKAVLEGGAGASLDDAPAPQITAFSAGYKGNALRLTDKQAAGLAIKAAKPPKKKPAPKKKAEEYEEEEEDYEEEEEPKPKKKKAAGKKKKKAASSDDDDDGDGEGEYKPRPSAKRAKRAA